MKTDVQSLVESNNSFALELYSKFSTTDGNLCISPFSVSIALAMTFAGARLATEKQMADVMHITAKQRSFHQGFSSLLDQLGSLGQKTEVELLFANSIFPHNKHSFLKPFEKCLSENYKTTITPLDYNKHEEARRFINQWVSEKTKGHISEIIQPGDIDPLIRLVLVNATYFEGSWEDPFNKKATIKQPFWVLDDHAVDVSTMRKRSAFHYSEDEFVQVLELPYQGKSLSLLIILPRDNLTVVENDLTLKNYSKWINGLSYSVVDIELPSFKIGYAKELNDTLISMGMMDAFDVDRADFSGMDGIKHPEGFFISKAIHQSYIEVNEEGTTATAATIMLARLGGIYDEYKQFHANRPFIFLLRENVTGSILFIGRVQNPLE